MALLTPAGVRSLLDEYGLRPSRALGQHFLADPNTARRVARLAGVGPGDRVLEIGPGLGSLTLALLESGARVVALEMDRHLAPVLEHVLSEADGDARVVVDDALHTDYRALLGDGRWRCVSNLPYNIATPVVMTLLEHAPMVETILVMVQREVGERLAASPGSRAYGAVSVKLAYFATARVVGTVPPTVFVPKPKVESVLVELVRRDTPSVDVPSRDELFALVQAGFAHRRKMLRQSMRGVLGEEAVDVLARAGIDPEARAETLALDDWASLARAASAR
ncbi:MAG TPA: 16S rRNA (adenine(1518)-N(6)/adenine(1519)-N(6))-dimethyltransferase RsmA [Acidimicrobiia bacterium]